MVEETIKYPDGSVYVGEVKDGEENGRGILTFPDGRRYEGEWKDGEEWTGTWTDADGSKTEYKDGEEI